jgi:hypothetical protein
MKLPFSSNLQMTVKSVITLMKKFIVRLTAMDNFIALQGNALTKILETV